MGGNIGANVAIGIGAGLISASATAGFVGRALPDGPGAISESKAAAAISSGLFMSSIMAFGAVGVAGTMAAAGSRELGVQLLPGMLIGAVGGAAVGAALRTLDG